MSIKVMTLVWESDLPRNQKMVLLAYADFAHDDGTSIFPSVGRVAWKTGYSKRAVQKITRQLESDGILVPIGTGPVGQNRFRIALNELPERPPWGEGESDTEGGEKTAPPEESAPRGAKKTAEGGEESSPKPSVNHQLEPPGAAARPRERTDAHGAFENHIHLINSKQVSDKLFRLVDRYGEKTVIDAIIEAGQSGGRSINYVEAILDRWEREGRGDSNGKSEAAKTWDELIDFANGGISRQGFKELSEEAQHWWRKLGGESEFRRLSTKEMRIRYYEERKYEHQG